jgi:hypothetical protein
MFSGYITGTWTAIETMIGDLWEAALNTHPEILAALNGTRKNANYRLSERAENKRRSST